MKKYYTPRMGLATHVLIDQSKLAEGCVVNAQPDEELVVHGHTQPRYSASGEEELHLRNIKGERVGVANLSAATEVGEVDDDGSDEDSDEDSIDFDDLHDCQDMADPDAPEERDWLTNKEMDAAEGNT